MRQRWYDNDPTLSMAISLLQNASRTHQEMAARYLFNLMENRKLFSSEELRTKEDRVRFIFPTFRRSHFEPHARHAVELIKHLAPKAQQEMAIALINYIYILDGGILDFPMPEDDDAVRAMLSHTEIG